MRHRKWGEPGDHPSPDALMFYVDGELPPDDSAALTEHLKQCWTCRVYTERLERGIRRFVDRRRRLQSGFPVPPGGWHGLALRLRAAEPEVARERSLEARLRAVFQKLPRPVFISAGFAAAVVTAMVTRSILIPAAPEASDAAKTNSTAVPHVASPAPDLRRPFVATIHPKIAPLPDTSPVPSLPAPSPEELAESEWRARSILRRIGADHGQDLRFESDPQTVILSGIVDSNEIRQQLASELQDLPHLNLRIRLVTEVNAASGAPGDTQGVVNVARPSPAFSEQLQARFPARADRVSFVDSVLEDSGRASSEAFALRALLDRYAGRSISLLNAQSQAELQQMIRDEVSAIEAAIMAAEKKARPFLSERSSPSAGSQPIMTWRQRLIRITALSIEANERVLEAFSGADSSRTADFVRSSLGTDFESLLVLLPAARAQLDQPFLLLSQPEDK